MAKTCMTCKHNQNIGKQEPCDSCCREYSSNGWAGSNYEAKEPAPTTWKPLFPALKSRTK